MMSLSLCLSRVSESGFEKSHWVSLIFQGSTTRLHQETLSWRLLHLQQQGRGGVKVTEPETLGGINDPSPLPLMDALHARVQTRA